MATYLTLAACAIFLIAWAWYLLAGRRPNIVSWALFCVATTVNLSTYHAMAGDWVKQAVMATDCVVCYGTFGFLLIKRERWDRPVPLDWVILIICGISMTAWRLFGSPTSGNMIHQVAGVLSCVPTYRTVIADPHNEPAASWLLWALAFAMSAGVVVLRWTGNPAELVNPIQAMVMHLGIGLLALRQPK